eukprot:CAMPEP_0115850816 /NCGR_PEP_ID=MMETSP0287-20121206/12160_1 /TAXON_ID=412157 /ORGANISM="Chrysochromulina rotalis, Strain UIO044" /LENGTH=261 /DNA_ID=CAMNT_0003304827 /DNA_START=229 /DNA_END=1013 /DNA_ORIENTATION=-
MPVVHAYLRLVTPSFQTCLFLVTHMLSLFIKMKAMHRPDAARHSVHAHASSARAPAMLQPRYVSPSCAPSPHAATLRATAPQIRVSSCNNGGEEPWCRTSKPGGGSSGCGVRPSSASDDGALDVTIVSNPGGAANFIAAGLVCRQRVVSLCNGSIGGLLQCFGGVSPRRGGGTDACVTSKPGGGAMLNVVEGKGAPVTHAPPQTLVVKSFLDSETASSRVGEEEIGAAFAEGSIPVGMIPPDQCLAVPLALFAAEGTSSLA